MQEPFLIFLLTLISLSSKASDFDMNPTMQKAYSEIIKTNLTVGRTILENDKTNNGVKVYLKSYADLIQLLIAEDKNIYAQFIDNQTNRLEYLEKFRQKISLQSFPPSGDTHTYCLREIEIWTRSQRLLGNYQSL
jgi:hypothetical protein